MDNDHYGHVNNVAYYSFFDTAVNGFLIEASGTDIRDLPAIGVVAESGCQFLECELSGHHSRRARGGTPRYVEHRLRDCAVSERRGRAVRGGPLRPRLRGPGHAPPGADSGRDPNAWSRDWKSV